MQRRAMPQQETKMPEQERRLSYAEWMTVLFKKFSKDMDYINENTTDHERAQMRRANRMVTPNDNMTLRDIYDEMWELHAKYDKEETIGRTHENNDKNVEGMTEDDWDRWNDNLKRMKNERTGIYAHLKEQYTQEEYEQMRQLIRQPEKSVQTENAELKEWIRLMFEQSREDICKWREELNKKRKKKIEGSKEIENTEETIELLPENKHNRNKEPLEKKIKKIRRIHPKKPINTRENLEMMISGLVNVLNLPITDHREIMNFKNVRRSLTEIIERTHNKTMSKDFRKLLFKVNILEIKIHDDISAVSYTHLDVYKRQVQQ